MLYKNKKEAAEQRRNIKIKLISDKLLYSESYDVADKVFDVLRKSEIKELLEKLIETTAQKEIVCNKLAEAIFWEGK